MFHIFCDSRGIPEAQRAPAGTTLMSSFLATAAGSYSGSALKNYFYGVRAWHIIHGARWDMDQDVMDVMLKAVKALSPASSKRAPRPPFLVESLEAIRAQLDPSVPVRIATRRGNQIP